MVLPLAAALLVWAAARASDSLRPRLQPQAPSCKPEGPIAVTLQAEDVAPGVARAAFELCPVLELSSLSWSWELSPDVRLAEGDPGGAGAAGRGALTGGEARFQVPSDGRHHSARLVVQGELAHGGEPGQPETVTVVRTLSWNAPEPVTETVLSPDADTGTLSRVAVVPTTWTPAPAQAPAVRK